MNGLTYKIVNGIVYFSDGSVMNEQAFNYMKVDPAWERKRCPRCGKMGREVHSTFCFYCYEDD